MYHFDRYPDMAIYNRVPNPPFNTPNHPFHARSRNGEYSHHWTSADVTPRAMTSVTDSKNTGYGRQNGTYAANNNAYAAANPYGNRGHTGQTYGMHHSAADTAALAHGFQGLNLQNRTFVTQAKNAMMATPGNNYGGLTVAASMSAPPMYGATGQYVFPNGYSTTANGHNPGMYAIQGPQYMTQFGYQGYGQHDNSPQNWTPNTDGAGGVPTLITPRRESISSNENEQPATPSYGSYASFANGGVAIHRSPSGVFTHTTPSPTSVLGPYGVPLTKGQHQPHPEQSEVSPRIKLLVNQKPEIPRAIPAPSSPLKPLDRALENQRGETNVYIRGLLPETTDEMLHQWGSRFGDIKSSKSIIDMSTGLCKGFGFIKYHNYEDAENCIRGFHHLGYEVSFARESFYSKLKTFADEANTNLYVSNLPKSMNEHELAQLFHPHKVCSSRILRDKNGHGRGVGFARFETRDACEEVIKEYNNYTIKTAGEEELQIQIRYADTQEQKSLKQQTQAARQFRSAEYEIATQNWRAGLGHSQRSPVVNDAANEFEQYLGAGSNMAGSRWAQSALSALRYQGPPRSRLGVEPYTNASPQPSVQINLAVKTDTQVAADDSADSRNGLVSPVTVVEAVSPVDSATACEQK